MSNLELKFITFVIAVALLFLTVTQIQFHGYTIPAYKNQNNVGEGLADSETVHAGLEAILRSVRNRNTQSEWNKVVDSERKEILRFAQNETTTSAQNLMPAPFLDEAYLLHKFLHEKFGEGEIKTISNFTHKSIKVAVKSNNSKRQNLISNTSSAKMAPSEIAKLSLSRKEQARNSTASIHVSKNRVVRQETEKLKAAQHPHRKTQYLIYLCDNGRACGGWGDRQRGLVNAYLLAVVTSRRFGINMTLPCDVFNYYVPNEVNWRINYEEIRGKSYRFINGVGNQSFHDSLLTLDFNRVYPEDVIFLRTNLEHYWAIRANPNFKATYPAWARQSRHGFFRHGWNMLMKPSEHMQRHLNDILNECRYFNRSRPLVCAHVRIGVSSSNPQDSEVRNDVHLLSQLWSFLDPYVVNGSHVFLATDSNEVRNLSKTKFKSAHHDTGGRILHIDKQRLQRDACNGFETAILDQLVLTKCDVLVATNSMFSGRAAMIRGTNKDLYFFKKGITLRTDVLG